MNVKQGTGALRKCSDIEIIIRNKLLRKQNKSQKTGTFWKGISLTHPFSWSKIFFSVTLRNYIFLICKNLPTSNNYILPKFKTQFFHLFFEPMSSWFPKRQFIWHSPLIWSPFKTQISLWGNRNNIEVK